MNSAKELVEMDVARKDQLILMVRRSLKQQTVLLVSLAIATVSIIIITILYSNNAAVRVYEAIMIERGVIKNEREALRQERDSLRKLKDSLIVERYLLDAVKSQ